MRATILVLVAEAVDVEGAWSVSRTSDHRGPLPYTEGLGLSASSLLMKQQELSLKAVERISEMPLGKRGSKI